MQLPLSISLNDAANFANYFPGRNLEAVQSLQNFTKEDEKFIYLWGSDGTGKTHLLHAVCRAFSQRGEVACHLPLSQNQEISTEVLDSLEHLALVCLDDIQSIAGLRLWEAALFHLYNRLFATPARLVITGNAPPAKLKLALPDLISRLSQGLAFQLHPLDDEGKLAALRMRAQCRGIELPEDVAHFLLRRCPRDMPGLFNLLQSLDYASLASQHKLTIPFVSKLIKNL